MIDQNTIEESFENLYHFEYYLFRKTFSKAFIFIGIINSLFFILGGYFYKSVVDIIGPHLPTIRFILFFIIFSYLYYVIGSLKRTKIAKGTVYHFKSKTGPILILGTFLFVSFGDVFLVGLLAKLYFQISFLGIYLYTTFILLIYHILHVNYFPGQKNVFVKKFLVVTFVVALISFIIVNPSQFTSYILNPIDLGYVDRGYVPLGPRISYIENFMISAIINGILFLIFGLYEYFTIKRILRKS